MGTNMRNNMNRNHYAGMDMDGDSDGFGGNSSSKVYDFLTTGISSSIF